jgi:hypothetical protein
MDRGCWAYAGGCCGTNRRSLAAWLYEVAYPIAVRLRSETARQHFHEKQVADMGIDKATADTRELAVIPDEELYRLPEKCRLME